MKTIHPYFQGDILPQINFIGAGGHFRPIVRRFLWFLKDFDFDYPQRTFMTILKIFTQIKWKSIIQNFCYRLKFSNNQYSQLKQELNLWFLREILVQCTKKSICIISSTFFPVILQFYHEHCIFGFVSNKWKKTKQS